MKLYKGDDTPLALNEARRYLVKRSSELAKKRREKERSKEREKRRKKPPIRLNSLL
jgi:hypothetical protein